MKQKGKIIESTFLIVSILWTCKKLMSGDYFHFAVGIGMTVFGCAGILYQVDKENKVVDGIVICGLLFMFLYFLLSR